MIGKRMKNSFIYEQLSLLSELNLPEHIFIPAYLHELRILLPSCFISYLWVDKDYKGIDFYDVHKHKKLVHALRNFIKKNSIPNSKDLFAYEYFFTNTKQWSGHPLGRLYRQCFLLNGYHQSCVIPIRFNNTPHGLMIFSWDSSTDNDDIIWPKAIKKIKNHLIKGLSNCKVKNKYVDGWHTGLIILDPHGAIIHCCQDGSNLVAMALQRKQGNLVLDNASDIRCIPGIMEIITETISSKAISKMRTLEVKSLWGSFEIKAFPVFDDYGQRETHIYLNITWKVPLSWLLFRNIESMQFTRRQAEIGLLYASGMPTKAISNKLDLSQYTIKEHIHHIFLRLDIHSRAELIEYIICNKCSENSQLQSNDI